MHKIDKYIEVIASSDCYITPMNAIKRKITPPSLYFFPRLAKIVLYSNKWVKRGVYDRFHWVYSSLDIFHKLENTGLRFEICGMNNLTKANGPVVFIGNHMSTLETLVLPGIIQPVKPVVFIIKKELAKFPFFGPIAEARYPIEVGRKNPREDLKLVLEEGKNRLQNGKSIVVFPQKTRTAFFESKSFNSLGVKLAKLNQVPVIPFALVTDAWGNGKIIKEFGKIDPSKKVFIHFGEPVEVTKKGNDAHRHVLDFIKSSLLKWGRPELILD